MNTAEPAPQAQMCTSPASISGRSEAALLNELGPQVKRPSPLPFPAHLSGEHASQRHAAEASRMLH
jgi:hypothetical protein